MKTKPVTPYQRLLKAAQDFTRKLNVRTSKTMFFYPKNRLREGWTLHEVYERVTAAETLGYDVMLSADAAGLHMRYVKKIPPIPCEFQY